MEYKVDKDRILEDIALIKKYLKVIETRYKKREDNENQDEVEFRYLGVSMAFFTILNKMIELGEELVDNLNKNYTFTKYNEIVKILESEKILTSKQAKIFSDFIAYRNEIAHEYDEIYSNEIDWCIKNIDFVEEFVKIVKKELLK